MFHKRNTLSSLPGVSQYDAAAASKARIPAKQQVKTNTKTNPISNTNKDVKEGQSAMNNQNENNNNQASAPATSRPMDIPGTMPYGRPANPTGGAGYGAAAAPNASAGYNPYGSGRKLIIGEGITMSGEIEHCDHLIVEGTVQATLKDAKLLDISEAGVFYGTVDIEEATIAGRFEGDIVIAGRLTVKSTGVITGSIRYKELAVEAGATIEGSLLPNTSGASHKSEDTIASADFSKGKAVAKQARESASKSNDQLQLGKNENASAAE